MEEKLQRVVNSLEGITYGEWKKISFAIEETYKREADTVANKMSVPALEKIKSIYKQMFIL